MKLKTILFTCLLMLSSALPMMAQTSKLTDEQVITYAQQRKEAGATTQSIAKELMAKGATKQQLMSIAKAQSKSLGGSTLSGTTGGATGSATGDDITRSRTNNEEDAPIFDEEELAEVEPVRTIFGHDIFRSKELSFEPNMSMAISPTYVLGAGDELIIDVYGASQNSQKLTVAPDGSVTIPRIGPVYVSGLTVEKAQARVRAAMGGHYKNASIKVSVGQTRTISISVMGEVKIPGTYTLSAFATVFHALYMAGGVNDVGTLRNIQVARNGRIISTVDVYEYIITGRLAGSVKLRDNDVIIVGPYDNLVQIDGKVKRPMWYEMKKNESISSLLRFCGGFTGDAFKKNVTVNRRAGDKWAVYTVGEFDFNSFKLADEDSINIPENERRYENMVAISGAVKRPGLYGLKASVSVRGLINLAGGLEEDAMKNRAVIVRMQQDRTRKTVSVDLGGILNGSTPDVALQNEDSVVIASLAEIIDDRKLSISGEVWNPGDYSYSDNTSIQDLVVMAGGLKESAALLNVEVSRRIVDSSADKDADVKSEVYTFNLTKDMNVDMDSKFKLLPYDRVYVHRSPVYDIQMSVNVSGEVMFAGDYALKDNNVRLSDIINKAGGLKKNAAAKNARLIRRLDRDDLARFHQLAKMKETQTDSVKIEKIGADSTYTVGINMDLALAHPGSSYDILLRDSDQIIVPGNVSTVKISGEVLHHNIVTYVPGKRGHYYITQAGGYTNKSYKRHAYIVYANGNVSKLSRGKIEPGCEIIVPTKEKRDSANDVMKWVSIGSTVTTLAAVIVNLLK